jgi:hypothetical protein
MLKKSYSKLVLSIFLLSLGLFRYQYAQGPDTLWTKTFGGGTDDYGYSVQQTLDGGYIIAGCTYSFDVGEGDVWLIKTDDSGDTSWTKTYGGSGYDYAYSVQQTTDGGYIMTGMTESFGAGDGDVWLIKTTASGDTLWTKTFGSIEIDAGNCVQQTSDGGYIITGYTYDLGPDVWLIKTNASGDTTWTKTIGGNAIDWGVFVQQTSDSGYIITGSTTSFGTGEDDLWLIKTDDSGDTLWTRALGGANSDGGYTVQQASDGGYVITGYTNSFGAGDYDVWLIKTNASGNTTWAKTFGGNAADMGLSVQQTSDGGYITTGYTSSFGLGVQNVWLIKTTASGDTLWTKIIGGTYENEISYSVQQTTDGGFIITGMTESFGAGDKDAWLIKTGTDPGVVEYDDQSTISGKYVLKQNFPNPFNASTRISYSLSHPNFVTLTVYDILGKKVKILVNEFKNADEYSVTFDASELSNGLYFYELKIGDTMVETKKMLLLR